MEFKVGKITVEIIRAKKASSIEENRNRAAAFIYKLAEMNFKKEQQVTNHYN